jgi:hypothetical protein
VSCWRPWIGVLLTALGMDTGKASQDERVTMGVSGDNEKGGAGNKWTRRYSGDRAETKNGAEAPFLHA